MANHNTIAWLRQTNRWSLTGADQGRRRERPNVNANYNQEGIAREIVLRDMKRAEA